MKKFIFLVSIIALSFFTVAFASDEIEVSIDGEYIEFDVEPQLINNRTMVPFRAIFEALGAEVHWENDTKTAVGIKSDTVIRAQINHKTMYVDDIAKVMDVAPTIVGGRTLVPARFIAEAFKCDVDWDNKKREVIITTNRKLSENEIISRVEARVGSGLIIIVEKNFINNSKKYYQISVKAKPTLPEMASFIISEDGREFFEGKYDEKTATLTNYEQFEIYESMVQE